MILAGNGDIELVFPVLFELRADEEYQNQVDDLFHGCHQKALQKMAGILIKQIQDENFLYRKEAGDTLAALGQLEPSIVSLLRGLLQDPREGVRIVGAKTLGRIGSIAQEALPELRRLLTTESPEGQQQIAEAIGQIEPSYLGLVRSVILSMEVERGHVGPSRALVIDEKSPIPKDVVPGLMAELTNDDEEVRDAARKGLVAIGPEAGPGILKELCSSKDAGLWREGCEVLRTISLRSPGVLAGLIAGLASEVPGVQVAAANSLEEIGPEAAWGVPGLLKMLNSKDERVRAAGVRALGKMGTAAEGTIPQILSLLKDESKFVRLAACQALFRLQMKPDIFLPTLNRLLVEDENPQKGNEEPEVMAPRIGIEINEEDDVVLLPLEAEKMAALKVLREVEGMTDETTGFANKLVSFVIEMGKSGGILAPALMQGQGTKDLRVDGYGKREICPLLPEAFQVMKPQEAIHALMPALKHPDPQVRFMAVRSLGRIKPATSEAVAALVAALQDDGSFKTPGWCFGAIENTVRDQAIRSLGELGPEAANSVPALIACLSVQDMSGKREVIRVLDRIGPAAREAVPLLWKMQTEDSRPFGSRILLAIARIAPDHPECAPAVIKYLERVEQGELPDKLSDADFGEIREAVVLLGKRAERAVPILEKMIEEKEYLYIDFRCSAAGAVARVHPENRTAINFLKRMTQDESSVLYNWEAKRQLAIIERMGAVSED